MVPSMTSLVSGEGVPKEGPSSCVTRPSAGDATLLPWASFHFSLSFLLFYDGLRYPRLA